MLEHHLQTSVAHVDTQRSQLEAVHTKVGTPTWMPGASRSDQVWNAQAPMPAWGMQNSRTASGLTVTGFLSGSSQLPCWLVSSIVLCEGRSCDVLVTVWRLWVRACVAEMSCSRNDVVLAGAGGVLARVD